MNRTAEIDWRLDQMAIALEDSACLGREKLLSQGRDVSTLTLSGREEEAASIQFALLLAELCAYDDEASTNRASSAIADYSL